MRQATVSHPLMRQIRRHILSTYFLLVCLISLILMVATAALIIRNASNNTLRFLQRSATGIFSIEQQAKQDALDAYVSDEGKLLHARYKLNKAQEFRCLRQIQNMITKNTIIHSLYFYDAADDKLAIFGSYNCRIPSNRYLDKEELSFLLTEAESGNPYLLDLLDSIHLYSRSQVYTTVYKTEGENALIINLEPDALFGGLSRSISTSGNDRYAVIDNAGRVLLTNIEAGDTLTIHLMQKQLDKSEINEVSATVLHAGKLYQVSLHQPSGAPWSVIVVSDWRNLFSFPPMVLPLFVLVIPLGFLISMLFNRSVSKLISAPFLYIQRTLPVQQRHFLTGILRNGTPGEDTFFEQCKEQQLPFRKGCRFLPLYVQWYIAADSELAEASAESVPAALNSSLREHCPELSHFYLLDRNDKNAVILSEPAPSFTPETLAQKLKELHSVFLEQLSVYIFFGIGEVVNSPAELPSAYTDLIRRFSSCLFFDPELGAALRSDILIRETQQEIISFTGIAQLRQAICSDDMDSCGRLLDTFFIQLESADYETVQFSLSTLCVQLEGLRRDLARSYPSLAELRNVFQSVMTAPTLMLSQSELLEAIGRIASIIRLNTTGTRDKLITTILDSISQSYSDSSLSAKQIAASYHISTATLNQMFNQRTGKSMMGYLKDLRLRKASELLLNSSLTIETIALQVGFENTTYFHTAFKAAFGCTPNQYRSIHAVYGKTPSQN